MQVFTLFRKCHQIYDGNVTKENDIATLGKCTITITLYLIIFLNVSLLDTNIKAFMHYYRTSFPLTSHPRATVLPKMHFLEAHVIPWLQRWRIGFGMMGEQGAESIHKYFNGLMRPYSGITNEVDKLKLMMREHLLHVAPANVAAKPPVKCRKKTAPSP